MPELRFCWLIILVALLPMAGAAPVPAKPAIFYLAPNGDDHWTGGQPAANNQRTDGPLRSLSAALQHAGQARRHGAGEVRILLREGIYTPVEPIVLTAEDSDLSIAAWRRETPVISGQTVISGWKRSHFDSHIWQTEIAGVRNGDWIFHELFVDGQRKERTRIPEQGFFRTVGSGVPGHPDELQFHSGEIQTALAQPEDVELIVFAAWAQSRNQIRKVFDASNIVSLAGSALPNRAEPNGRFHIENAPVKLRPGQWYLDVRSGLLTYWPDTGEDIPNATITAPHLYDLVQIKGDAQHPAHGIDFRGITFADTDWSLDGGSDLDMQAGQDHRQ